MTVQTNAWIAAIVCTTLISLAPNLLLLLFPQYASGEGATSNVLACGQALAAGGLLGDVFLHTLSSSHSHDDDHPPGEHNNNKEDDISSGVWVLIGFSIFLVTDMIIRSFGGHVHAHHHHHNSSPSKEGTNHNHNFLAITTTTTTPTTTSTILLNLAADALHNFTDGLAIGASFSISALQPKNHNASVWTLLQSKGGLATLSILFHEIPHELGDFAILVRNGFSKQQAIMAQFGTAVAAMLGTLMGIGLQEGLFALSSGVGGGRGMVNEESLLFLTAGGFVYLACVSILPELLDDETTSLQFRLLQILCFFAGIGFLYIVTFLEEMGDVGVGGGGDHDHAHDHGHHHNHIHVEHVPPHHEHIHSHQVHHAHHEHSHDHGHYHEL